MGQLVNYKVVATDRTTGERKEFLYAAESDAALYAILSSRYIVERAKPEGTSPFQDRSPREIISFSVILISTLVIVIFALMIIYNV